MIRFTTAAVFACALLAAPGAAQNAAWAADDEVALGAAPHKIEHPGTVALVEESASSWKYVQFPTSLRLYVFDGDRDGQSLCNTGCDSAWPPLLAEESEGPVGDWTIIQRDDGRRQWAYKGRPVYMRFHDSIANPTGDGINGTWHFLKP